MTTLFSSSPWLATAAGATVVVGLTVFTLVYGSGSQGRRGRNGRRLSPDATFSVQDSVTQFTDLIVPMQCAQSGIMFGGELLSLMDLVGGTTAFKHCHGPIVTVSIDNVHFVAMAQSHEILLMKGRVNAVFRSSLEVEVTVEAEHGLSGHRRTVCTGRLVFVHLSSSDGARRPQKVPGLTLKSDEERDRAQQATARRAERTKETKAGGVVTDGNGDAWWKQQWPKEFEELQAFEKQTLSDKSTALVNASDTAVEVSKVVMPQHANPLGIAFGGQIMAWMEHAAAISATRLCRQHVVSVGLDRMSFSKPSHVGNIIVVKARITRVFGSSLEVHVTVHKFSGEDSDNNGGTAGAAASSSGEFCNSGYFSLVCITGQRNEGNNTNKEGPQPTPVGKQVLPVSDDEKKEFCEALRRREARLLDKRESGL